MTTIHTDNSRSIGNTPLVRLNRIAADAKATVLAKIEDLAAEVRDITQELEEGSRIRRKTSDPQEVPSANALCEKYAELAGMELFLAGSKFRRAYPDLRQSWETNLPARTYVEYGFQPVLSSAARCA